MKWHELCVAILTSSSLAALKAASHMEATIEVWLTVQFWPATHSSQGLPSVTLPSFHIGLWPIHVKFWYLQIHR